MASAARIRSGLFERRRGVVQTSFEDVLSGRGLGQARVVLRVTLGKLHRHRRPLRRMPFVGTLTFRLRLRQPRFERLARGGFLSEPPLELHFAPRQLLGCGGGLCRLILPRLIELRLDVAQPPFENVPGGCGLREARFMLCLTLGELFRAGSLLRRVPLLIVRALCFGIRQSCFGRLARGHFLSEPLLDLRFAQRQLLGCCGGLSRSILPRSIEFRLEVAQPPFENVPGGRGLREARFMLCLTLGELLRCGSLLRRVPLLIVRALCFRIRHSCFGRLASGHFPTEPLLEIRFAQRQLLGRCGGLCRSILPRSNRVPPRGRPTAVRERPGRPQLARGSRRAVPGARPAASQRLSAPTRGVAHRPRALLPHPPGALRPPGARSRVTRSCSAAWKPLTRVMVGRRAPGCLLKVALPPPRSGVRAPVARPRLRRARFPAGRAPSGILRAPTRRR